MATTLPQLVAYIDPGTGSMLFTLAIGLVSAGYFFFRKLAIRLRFLISGGNAKDSGERHAYVIFSDDRRYWNVFKPICDELERRGIDACYWTASPDDPGLDERYEHVSCEFIGEGNKAFARLNTMSADVVLATTPGLQVYQWKRSDGVRWYAHILHATSTAAWYRMFGLDFFDAVLLSNEYQVGEVRELERKRGLKPKELPIVGCSYMDSMADRLRLEEERDAGAWNGDCEAGTQNEGCALDDAHAHDEASDAGVQDEPSDTSARSKRHAQVKSKTRDEGCPAHDDGASSQLTVLLAPTWGPNGLLARYGERIIEALVRTGFEIVVRPHPQSMKSEREMMDRLMAAYPDGKAVEWNFDNDNFSVLRRSDVLISDMSGVIHDFALVFDRPVIYALGGIDTAPFDAAWLDEPFWETSIFTDTGVPVDEAQFDDLRQAILDVISDEAVRERRRRAIDEGWFYQGECATRTVDYLVAKREELTTTQE